MRSWCPRRVSTTRCGGSRPVSGSTDPAPSNSSIGFLDGRGVGTDFEHFAIADSPDTRSYGESRRPLEICQARVHLVQAYGQRRPANRL